MKEERLAILRMLENGVISADEAERLLNILNENSQKSDNGSFEEAFSKAGSTLENIVENVSKKVGTAAKTVGEKAEEAKPEIKKAVKTVVEKVSEAAETIKVEFNNRNVSKDAAEKSDFVYEGEANEKDINPSDAEVNQNDIKQNPTVQSSETENLSDAESSDFPSNEKTEDTKVEETQSSAEPDDDGRDYEAEYYQMMKETDGGDIFGDVYKAMDNLKGIDSSKIEAANEAETDKKDKE